MCFKKTVSFDALYYNTKNSSAYSSRKRFLKAAKDHGIERNSADWLQSQRAYTLHKPRRNRFRRNKYSLTNIGDLWQADLMDMQKLSRKNSGYKYVLAVIDCFSKFGWCIPIKNKKPGEIIRAFKIILIKARYRPRNLHTDKGREFVNKSFLNFLGQNDITFYKAADPTTKAAICERYIRSMKSLIYRYFTYLGTTKYCDVLDGLVGLYNSREHRSIGMAPLEVNEKNILQVWENLNARIIKRQKPLLHCGDFVRLAKAKEVFDKGYKPSWTSEIFIVKKVIPHAQPVYEVKDEKDNDISGVFYEPELQKVHRTPEDD